MIEVRLIDANALKQDLELSKYIVPNSLNRLLNTEINRCIAAIDNAPTVPLPVIKLNDKVTDEDIETFKQLMKDCKPQILYKDTIGVLDVKSQNKLAKEVWELYEKHHSHLATYVLEFGYELRELLDKYQESSVEKPQGECRTCRHRDPEDKKCDCGGLERQGCPFPVSDNYFCKFYEKGGEENDT